MASGGLKLGVGLSLGLSLGVLANQSIVDRIFSKTEPPAAQSSTVDTKLVEHLISHDRKVNQLENQLTTLRNDLRERQMQAEALADVNQAPARANGNVFELSQVLDANNLAHSARHERDLEDQRRALVREHSLKTEGAILKVENKYRPIINKIRELETKLEEQQKAMQRELPVRLSWIACQDLLTKISHGSQRALADEPSFKILQRVNPVASEILNSIPKVPVPSDMSLASRFEKVERVCKRVALVQAQGGGITSYLLSYIQSLFVLDNLKVPEDEVSGNRLVDPSKWTTQEILARVRYCLSHDDLEQAVRYANQLRGQARVVTRDWIRDARVNLATRQALETLSAIYSS